MIFSKIKLRSYIHFFTDFFDEFIPKATPRISNRPIWYDKKLSKLKNTRNKYYNKLCRERVLNPKDDDTELVKARDEFDSYQKHLYENYVKELAENPNKIQRFFGIMSTVKERATQYRVK